MGSEYGKNDDGTQYILRDSWSAGSSRIRRHPRALVTHRSNCLGRHHRHFPNPSMTIQTPTFNSSMKSLVPPVITITPKSMNKPRRKKVRFAPARSEIVEYVASRSDLSLEESKHIWWTPSEMREFRHAAKTMSRETRGTTWMIQSVEEAFNTARQIASSFPEDTLTSEALQHIKPREDFVDWCRYGHSRRGLERWSCKAHKDARAEAASKARKRVIEMHKCNSDFLRRIYERFSRASKVYARLIGLADAEAVVPLPTSTCLGSFPHTTTEETLKRVGASAHRPEGSICKDSSQSFSSQYHAVCA